MPYLKDDHGEATRIHEEYQQANDQRAFLSAARTFLERQQESKPSSHPSQNFSAQSSIQRPNPPFPPQDQSLTSSSQSNIQPMFGGPTPTLPPDGSRLGQGPHNLAIGPRRSQAPPPPQQHPFRPPGTSHAAEGGMIGSNDLHSNGTMNMSAMANGLSELQGNPIVRIPGSTIWGNTNGSNGMSLPLTPPRPGTSGPSPALGRAQPIPTSSPWGQGEQQQQALPGLGSSLFSTSPQQTPTILSGPGGAPKVPDEPERKNDAPTPTVNPKREPPPPKRLWTRFEEQPGRITVDNVSGQDLSRVIPLGPRAELMANWSLPLAYVRQCAQKIGPQASLEDVLRGLTVGLFRRGCTENGTQASIISKLVMGENNRNYEYWKDPNTGTVRGRVPFFSPRTPGYVIFRLYMDKEPLYTLAMGPSLLVCVRESDYEGSVRFVLSNFKGKKSNPTSLSSLHSLAIVLQTQLTRPSDSAARATWGCIQEARKVLEACAHEYKKTSAKLAESERVVNELKQEVDKEAEAKSEAASSDDTEGDESELVLEFREKTRILNSGRASCERKWRDSQQAFSGILKAVVSNPSMSALLRRDIVARIRVEYELWCPLSEEFAVPSHDANGGELWLEYLGALPQNITADHFRAYSQARQRMQQRTLGFEPNTSAMRQVLFPTSNGNANMQQQPMDARAVNIFNNVSAAMGQNYQNLYANEEMVVRQRELIRERTQGCVDKSGAFPAGTRVVIFGSSANGFGSPKSDLDMCLQIPEAEASNFTGESGQEAMAKLASVFEEEGMAEVDTSRLGARIPIVMYHCPNPLADGESDNDYVECDLSMHNTLAVLNTSLLRSYAEITPVTRVLASIVKRWAKARDINNPARHTLSSYGYIIMLLHFLTYHKRSGDGLVLPIDNTDPSETRNRNNRHHTPILPNLQWMDPMWPNFPVGTPYRESEIIPPVMRKHPLEENKTVNVHFYKAQTPNDKTKLQTLFPGQDLSLGLLLASFFRYYAYDFNYKRYVVSLHSTANRGMVEREVKAELDGWRNYSAALTVEDPFETFYDVAHVLRGGYYHRIRREFTIAYSKIADAASGHSGTWDKDPTNMSGEELLDWICEPVSTDRE